MTALESAWAWIAARAGDGPFLELGAELVIGRRLRGPCVGLDEVEEGMPLGLEASDVMGV